LSGLEFLREYEAHLPAISFDTAGGISTVHMPVAGFHRALLPPPLLMLYAVVGIYHIMLEGVVKVLKAMVIS